MSKVNIEDVATHAGVSVKTVSRVLNNESNVRDKTRTKVLATIEALGYKPNLYARRLRQNRSYLIGILYDNPTETYINAMLNGALSGCNEQGYELIIRPVDYLSADLIKQVTDLVERSKVDGIILSPPLSDNVALIDALNLLNVATVRISPMHKQGNPYVVCNETDAAKQVVEHFHYLGHQHIGIIIGHPEHGASQWRLSGYRQAMESAGIKVLPDWEQQGDFSFESGERCARKLLTLPERPTAIFASNDAMAAGVYKVAHQLGIRVPHQLSVIGFDDAPVAGYLWPPLTTVRQPIFDLAKQAAEQVIEQIAHSDTPVPNRETLECELVVRHSTSPVV